MTALDFIGFGESPSLSEPFSISDYAAWLIALLPKLKLNRPHVIAHSFGCRVAVKAASLHSELFGNILLTGPAGVILNRGANYRAKVGAYRFVKRIFPSFAETHFGSKEYRSLPPIMKESYKKIVNEDLRADAKKVQNPVLLVEGTEDRVTTMAEAEAYLQAFPNGKLKTVSGGHFAFAENPVPFNLIAEEFFND